VKRAVLVFAALASMVVVGSVWSEKAPQALVDYANATLASWGANPVIVAAVKAENAKKKTLEQIKAQDKAWIATPGIDATMTALMQNDAAKALKKLQQESPFIGESFVMDNQGANVAMTDKTSDYWQGDEAKFQKSFAGGAGAIFIDEVKFDESSQTYLVQVSLPVKDGAVVIGAITIGIDVDKFMKGR
jgi:hypothetical protein